MDIKKFRGPDRMHPQVLRELTDVIARLVSLSLKGHGDKASFLRSGGEQMSLLPSKKGKEDAGNCRLVNLTLIPGKVMEQIILESISKNRMDKVVIGSSQPGFMKGK